MSRTIFIIDDDPFICMIVKRLLTKVDDSLNFVLCEDGRDGLEKLKDYQGSFSNCVVLLDLNMPVLDGWGFLDELPLNLNDDYSELTIHIHTSSIDKRDIERAQQYPIVKKFYHKPLSNDDISEILSN
jgi:CheY-like chemotaxis protein